MRKQQNEKKKNRVTMRERYRQRVRMIVNKQKDKGRIRDVRKLKRGKERQFVIITQQTFIQRQENCQYYRFFKIGQNINDLVIQ